MLAVPLKEKMWSYYTGSLAPTDFNGAVFTCAYLKKKYPVYPAYAIFTTVQACYSSEEIPSLMRFWLVMTSVMRIWFMRIFPLLKKRTSQELGVDS